jgi:hypothetical protein
LIFCASFSDRPRLEWVGKAFVACCLVCGHFPGEMQDRCFYSFIFFAALYRKKDVRLAAFCQPLILHFNKVFAGKIAGRIPNNSATQGAGRKDAT